MDYEDGPELAAAIALSQQEAAKQAQSSKDSEQQFQGRMPQGAEALILADTSSSARESNPPTKSAFLSERAQMEKERLKRIRKAKGLPEEEEEKLKDLSDDEDEIQIIEPPKKRQRVSSSGNLRAPSNVISSNSSAASTASDELFWDGEFRPTATAGVEPRKDRKSTFRLTQVLGKKTDIAFAIISTFAEDLSWIYQFFERDTPVIFVTQPDSTGEATIKNILPNWIKTTAFLRGGYGCMHMKFMLLFYKTGRLRIVISTANLVAFDWRDIGNAVWLQDLPPSSSPRTFDRKMTEPFQYMMKGVLDSVNVKPALATMLKQDHPNLPVKSTEEICTRWDWSKVRVHLVPSIAGKHEGWPNVVLTGHTRLMKAIRDLGLRTGTGSRSKSLQLEYQGSSIGTYTTQWLNEFYYSARGESAQDWLDQPKKRREKLPFPSGLKILFPTKDTVKGAQHGEPGGGTNFCQRKQWEGKNFPRELFHDSKSRAGKTLMHTKTMLATFAENNGSNQTADGEDSETEDDSDIEIIETSTGWAYIGSHNFTPSAWGTLSGSSFNPVMNIRNYELGIVFPLKNQQDVECVAAWERPPESYRARGKEPWVRVFYLVTST
ncbi:tyrosyl-dna phosphodiesterase domain protein [Moniliophthora roreri]|nr:tyrosyl-dna phosphodiesterase domain protein [Moniliophthora roreri]